MKVKHFRRHSHHDHLMTRLFGSKVQTPEQFWNSLHWFNKCLWLIVAALFTGLMIGMAADQLGFKFN